MKKATVKAVVSIIGGLVVFITAFWFFQSSPSTAEATMTRQEAEKIAQEQFQGEVVSVELDDGRYEIEIESEDARYELELDSETGEIIKLEEKRNQTQVEMTQESEVEETADSTEDKEQASKEENVESNQKSSEKDTNNVVISPSEAMNIARAQVSDATIIQIELDSDDGQRYYEIELHTDDQEVELEINAYTGEVIMYELEKLDGRRKGNSDLITMEEAIEIAFAEEPDAWFDEAQLDRNDGKYLYEVDLKSSRYDIEFEIDAKTGEIIDVEYDS